VFGYYFNLALRSLQRNIVLTALMIAAIGIGIGASMTMLTIFRAASGDPIPRKSAQLFVPQIDNFGPDSKMPPQSDDLLPPVVTYLDAEAWLRVHAAARQAAMYPISVAITPPDPGRNPVQVDARATSGDFFPMFDVPFRFGGPWSRGDDANHEAVVVLTRALNDLLFDGADSVGRNLTVNGKTYRVMGVLDDWHPTPRFYDVGGDTYSGQDQLFVPFTRAIDEQMPTIARLNCDRPGQGTGWDGLLHSNCVWIRFWVELPTARAVADYEAFLHSYAAEQQQRGRFDFRPRVALRNVPQWLSYNHVVPPAVETLTSVSFALLLVCVLNAVGLMLAKFMASTGVISVRRALGASRPAIFAQFMVEAGVIGLVGGLVGLGLTQLGLVSCRAILEKDLAGLMRLHGEDVLIALAVALAATLLAGLYPTWRAMHVQPAAQSSPRRNKLGATLIALQIALTLAVLCNALFIVEQQTGFSRAPTGIADESSTFFISNQWIGRTEDLAARIQADLTRLRALPQVADASVSPGRPLGGRGMGMNLTLHPGKPGSGALTTVFPVDDHGLNALGLRLVAGRNFRPEEVLTAHGFRDNYTSWGSVIVTQALARRIDPAGDVLGRMASLGRVTGTIIGVVDRLSSGQSAGNSTTAENSVLVPLLWADSNVFYLVRAKPGQTAAAMTAARDALYKISRQRTIVSMQTFADARRNFYRGARGVALLMSGICAILLGITAFGIIGLTSYWVSQRRRQIGIRRALGATAVSILRYFQMENLLIAGAGSILGVLLGIAANLWMLQSIALTRLPPAYLITGTVVVLILGQVAVLWPALRAAAVPPAIAARGS
jgi:putative ABC transport system permease protein